MVVATDALTKSWASAELQSAPIVIIPDFLVLTYGENSGAIGGLFQGAGPFIGVVAIALAAGILWSLRTARPVLEVVAFGLIVGTALGNVTDRLFRGEGFLDGAVIDWINLWRIPTFNVADAALTVAVGLLLIQSWLTR